MRGGLALPYQTGPSSLPARSHAVDRWWAARLQDSIRAAAVRIELWDGFVPGLSGPAVGDLVVRDRRALLGLIFNPDLYFGETYMAGRVAVRGDLEAVVEALSRLGKPGRPSWRERLALAVAPSNSLLVSRRNIHHHYDLGNDFYARWLDADLLYTCACYPRPDATLEDAQTYKLDLVCRKLGLRAGDRVVEAGCGWGALAIHMAKHYAVDVRAFNISSEQVAYARERLARETLTGRVEFIEDDYRQIRGDCDVFVSLGMLEHVGRREYSAMANVLRRVVRRSGGRGLLHFIGRDHPRPLNPWIRRRIFPGAYPPTLGEVMSRVLEPADLSVLDVENLRLHYARTLKDWRGRFERAEADVRATFGDCFYRAWRLYLAGSEAAFTTGWLQLFQIVFAPAGGTAVHWLRPGHGE